MGITTELEARGVEAAHLDELVHDAAGRLASAVNNDGMEAQVAFLLEQGFTREDILAAGSE